MKLIDTRLILLAVVCLSLAAVGCGPAAATMNGSVSYGGKPVANGMIMVQAVDQSGGAAKAKIVNGKYDMGEEAGLTEGTYRVQIHGYRKATKRAADPGENIKSGAEDVEIIESAGPAITGEANLESYIPSSYNIVTELKVEVKAGSNDNTNFDLKVVPERFLKR